MISERVWQNERWQNLSHHAWVVTKIATNNIVNNYYDSGFHAERKERSDKGQTLINSEKKRKSIYSGLFVYKREQKKIRYSNHTYKLDMLALFYLSLH